MSEVHQGMQMSITWKKGPQAGGAQEVGACSAPQGSRHGMWTEGLARVAGGWTDVSRQAGLPLCSAWGTHRAGARQKALQQDLPDFSWLSLPSGTLGDQSPLQCPYHGFRDKEAGWWQEE